ncbi:putative aldouronate transport system substrate-binding protein [Kribbella aluminosa]|uniref:Aldouronate transport system substrate-binding protein n=1 Tax=Kribbella aluminosa TaxID=416017 RepID=A0ABS4UJP8_9ACTN|nr:extracellular solute-binding protein [Kribbella aluminosa]MBP2351839.1 putative aldouronate transport system substrate-binding protein [Kribbella aluminosa]
MPELSRRQILGGSLAAVASAAGLPLLQGCSNKGRGGTDAGGADGIKLPKYIAYQDFTPDLTGKNGVDSATFKYPADPVAAISGPVGDGQRVAALTVTNSPAPPARGRNAYWQELERRLGFTFDIEIVPSTDYGQRFQTAVAGGKLPDLFSIYPGQVPSLPALLQKKAVDLTPHLSGDAISKYPLLANVPTVSWKQTVYDGKIYGIPIPRGAQSTLTLYSRDDLLTKLGITKPPASLQELQDLCKELTLAKTNTWALGRVPLTYLRQMFKIPNGWSVQNGRLVSAFEAEQQKDALEAGRKLMVAGVVHPDGFTAPGSIRKTWVANGSTLMVDDSFSAWHAFYNYPHPDTFRLAAWAPPIAEGGGTAPVWLGAPTINITAINLTASDRVEALLSLLNYLAAPFGTSEYLFKNYGVKDVHHTLKGTDPVLTDKGRTEIALGLEYVANAPWMTYQPGAPDVTKAQFDAQDTLVPTAVADPTISLYSETNVRKGNQIGMGDLELDILQGRKPVSAWDEGLAKWKKAGGDTIRDEFQKALDHQPS